MQSIKGTQLESDWKLDTVQVSDLIYYDGPLLSHRQDRDGNNYLYYWCDVDEECNRWLVIPTASEQIEQYLAGKKTLRSLITHPKDEVAYIIDIDDEGNYHNVKAIAISDLPEDYLPDSDAYHDPSLAMLDEEDGEEAIAAPEPEQEAIAAPSYSRSAAAIHKWFRKSALSMFVELGNDSYAVIHRL